MKNLFIIDNNLLEVTLFEPIKLLVIDKKRSVQACLKNYYLSLFQMEM